MDIELIATPILHKTMIRAKQKDVFKALATAKGYDRWFTSGTTLEARPGGKLVFRWRDWGAEHVTTESQAVVVAHEPYDRFVFNWWLDRPTTVMLQFQQTDEGTLVILHEEGYENTPEGWDRCLDCATGWGEALTLVKFYLEHGVTYR
jgi:uncharacterized protein YndB with AHSA1/START domain